MDDFGGVSGQGQPFFAVLGRDHLKNPAEFNERCASRK
jgi:hypothetical protein